MHNVSRYIGVKLILLLLWISDSLTIDQLLLYRIENYTDSQNS